MTHLEQLINETINKLSDKGITITYKQLLELSDNYILKIPITEELLDNYIVTDYTFSSFYHPDELYKELLSSYLTIRPNNISLNTNIFKYANEDEIPYLEEDLLKIQDELQNVLSTFNYIIESFFNKRNLAIKKDELGNEPLKKNELRDLIDKPGDEFKIDFDIYVGSRNQAFVYIDGKLAIGNDHSQLTKELLQNNEELPNYDAGRIDSYDLDIPVAFGHIINNFAFIEFVQNTTKQEVAENIINNEHIEKVYDYSNTHKIITRLAKSIYNSNELCYNIYKKANAPGNNLISKKTADELIKNYNSELLDTTKWQRFVMTGPEQGVVGIYGYCKKDNDIHYYYAEQHTFQTLGKQTKNTQYKNVFLDCEVDENGNIIGNINLKPGADSYPFIADMPLKNEYDFDNETKVKMVDKSLQNTIDTAKNSEN